MSEHTPTPWEACNAHKEMVELVREIADWTEEAPIDELVAVENAIQQDCPGRRARALLAKLDA